MIPFLQKEVISRIVSIKSVSVQKNKLLALIKSALRFKTGSYSLKRTFSTQVNRTCLLLPKS